MGVGARNAASDEAIIQVRGRNLKAELEALKEFDPILARNVRRELREAGKRVIGYMRVELDKEPLGLVTGVSKKTRYTTRKSSNRASGISVTRREYVTDVTTTGARGRGRGSREEIKAGLKVAIQTGRRSGIRIRGGGSGFAKAYNTKRFRHPVYGNRSTWVSQAGRPYFGEVITQRREELAQAILAALDAGLEEMNKGGA
ncbi:hypothetical protein [Demequina gelatinilytica]|uniref:hypothetical protein n=1 Tax=Demequina gelatinilytica TaxID=1638980 RepID=UPI0007819489|nr:hypothetical protein [Demequina gelatinilytica]